MKLKYSFVACLFLLNGLSFSFASEDMAEPAVKRRKILDTSIDKIADKTGQPNLLDMLPDDVFSQITSHLHIMVIAPLMLTEKKAEKKIQATTQVFNASEDPLYLNARLYKKNILLAFSHLIGKFPKLIEIDFQGYKNLFFFPFEPKEHLSLTKLNLSHNEFLSPLPPSISELRNLKSLDLSHAHFSDFLDEIYSLTSLTELDLSYIETVSSIKSIIGWPELILLETFSNLTALKSLKMEGVCIENTFPSLSTFTNLTLLNLAPPKGIPHFRGITKSLDFLLPLTSLTELHLPHSNEALPSSFSTFTNLQVLTFSPYINGTLREGLPLPFSLTSLSGDLPPQRNMDHWWDLNQEPLNLDYPFPESVQALPNLRSLTITNPISSIPTDITRLRNLHTLKVRIDEHSEKVFPYDIRRLTNLRTLKLTMQIKKNLILGIGHLTMLTKLTLLNTIKGAVQSLPEILGEELENLTNLQELTINGIYIRSLVPINFGFPALEVLRLTSNNLNFFPYGIIKAQKNLRVLDLSYNNSSIMDHTLPEFLIGMTALEKLTMVGCVLASFTPGLENLTRLQFLDLRDNYLDDDPHLILFKQRVKILN